jgi:predicted DNA-binding protein YlxM (UPF0122 family)
VEKRVQIGCLLDIYGGLLTERQQSVLDEHYNQDLSLSEIAQRRGISRQAVLDVLRRGEAQLSGWEKKLGVYALYRKNTQALDTCLALCDGIEGDGDALRALKKELNALRAGWEDADGI